MTWVPNSMVPTRQWFEGSLVTACRIYKDVRLQYRVLTDQFGRAVGDELMLAKTARTPSRYGFDPYFLRLSCQDNAVRCARMLNDIARGKIHPSMFAYLLSPKHQADVAVGNVRGFKAMERDKKDPLPTPSDKMTQDVTEAIAEDEEVRRIARKLNSFPARERDVLATRPHLLEEKP